MSVRLQYRHNEFLRIKNEFLKISKVLSEYHLMLLMLNNEAFPVVVYAGKAWTQVLTGY